MAIHRLPLMLNKKVRFWKLVGCGKNGSFDLSPDWQQWGLLAVWEERDDFEIFKKSSFIFWWWNRFTTEQWTILCSPISSHGKWGGKEPFKNDHPTTYDGPVAILTRAQIRISKLKNFWANVDGVSAILQKAPGYIDSVGIGEAPFFLQATFSIWHDQESVINFAYRSKEHAEVIRKTRSENWYSEELFARFRPIASYGSLNGKDPLENILATSPAETQNI